jgi:hypothetical protein
MMADTLGVKSDPNWIFGVASASDIRRLAAASGFWFQWDPSIQQYDHPSVVVAIDRGRVLRMLGGANVPDASLREVVQELRGKFVASYALTGKVAFRCFEYDPNSGRYSWIGEYCSCYYQQRSPCWQFFWAFFLTPGRSEQNEHAEPAEPTVW